MIQTRSKVFGNLQMHVDLTAEKVGALVGCQGDVGSSGNNLNLI